MRRELDQIEGKQVYIWWHDRALFNGNWRGRWLSYYSRKNDVWSMNPTPPSGSGAEPYVPLPDEVAPPIVGISWREVAVGEKRRVGSNVAGTDPFWLYALSDVRDVRRLDRMSNRGVVARLMHLSVNRDTDPETWYPLWVAGRPGSASLVSVNFKRMNVRFRYDQWGYPPSTIDLGGSCLDRELQVMVQINQFTRTVSINCNAEVAEVGFPDVETNLGVADTLGINKVTSRLEGKYPLAENFPGKLAEQPLTN